MTPSDLPAARFDRAAPVVEPDDPPLPDPAPLRARLAGVRARAEEIHEAANSEGRELTHREARRLLRLHAAELELEPRIHRLEEAIERQRFMNTPIRDDTCVGATGFLDPEEW